LRVLGEAPPTHLPTQENHVLLIKTRYRLSKKACGAPAFSACTASTFSSDARRAWLGSTFTEPMKPWIVPW
jgi:hypothetical protein